MHSGQIQNLILAQLVRSVGGTRQHWRRVMGQLRVHSIKTHPHCNWDVYASGSPAEVHAINKVVDQLRTMHPHVTG